MADTGKKVAIAGGVIAVAAGAGYLIFRGKPEAAPGKATLYGTVLDADTGLPLKAAFVNMDGYDGKTDKHGNYELINIEPGTYTAVFSKADYEEAFMSVTLYADIATPLDVALVPVEAPPGAATLYGRVTHAETGLPLAGVFVSANGYVGYTDTNGDYTIPGIPPGTYEVEFSLAGYETQIF